MQLQDMQTRLTQRLDEVASGPTYYPASEQVAALNEAQRMFCYMTLGLEVTATWTAPGYVANNSSPFHRMMGYFPDWIVALRIATPSGAKVRGATPAELGALNSGWVNYPAKPSRYTFLGTDLMGLYGQPAVSTPLNVTYARNPVAMVNPTDTPEIPEEYHPSLIEYGINRLRQQEGGQEFEKTLPHLDSFLTMAQKYAVFVRARNEAAGYDKLPFELQKFDRSALLRLRQSNKTG